MRFWFHYNKPASRREERNVLTLHWKGTCHRVHSVKCLVPVESHNRKTQPKCIMRGFAENVSIVDINGNTEASIT